MDKKYLYLFVLVAVILVGYYFLFSSKPAYAEGYVDGPLHWHSQLTVMINGKNVTIPNDVGLDFTPESPVHTHEEGNGTIHLEFSASKVPRNQLAVGYFINKVWKQPFNSTCILNECNAGNKTVKMFVNGKPNNEFDKYVMKDDDEILIRYD
ncbi:hypothetical protein HZC07_04545 [Candidatus Micrarchaeota archaeon]|nr:hypothetical protein [Candidatus Micrarchaeota archaeon]